MLPCFQDLHQTAEPRPSGDNISLPHSRTQPPSPCQQVGSRQDFRPENPILAARPRPDKARSPPGLAAQPRHHTPWSTHTFSHRTICSRGASHRHQSTSHHPTATMCGLSCRHEVRRRRRPPTKRSPATRTVAPAASTASGRTYSACRRPKQHAAPTRVGSSTSSAEPSCVRGRCPP